MVEEIREKSEEETIRRITIFFLFALIFTLSCHILSDVDIWWHLGAGKYILENQHIPKVDIFSYTAAGRPWIDLHWLFQVLSFLIYEILGVNGLIILRITVLLFAFVFLFQIGYRKSNFLISVLCFIPGVVAASSRFHERPEIFTFLFMAMYLFVLHKYKYENKNYIWILPILQVLWVNIHGLFILGTGMVFAYLFGEVVSWKAGIPFLKNSEFTIKGRRYYKLLLVGVLMILACFINPYGFKGVLFPFVLFTRIGTSTNIYARSILEFQRPFSIHPVPYDIFYYKIALILSVITLLVNIKRTDLSRVLIYTAFLYLSLLARRNVAIFVLAALPFMVTNLNETLSSLRLTRQGKLKQVLANSFGIGKSFLAKRWTAIALILFMGWSIWNIASNKFYLRMRVPASWGFGVNELFFPRRACDFVEENGISGPIFNNLGAGGYLIWRFYPSRKVFIDGRLEVYDTTHYALYQRTLSDEEVWKQVVNHYDINCVILSHILPGISDMIRRLYSDKNWKLIYYDDVAAVFIRNHERNQRIIEMGQQDSTLSGGGTYFSCLYRGDFFSTIGLSERAIKEYEKAIELYPRCVVAHNNLGNLYLAKGWYEKALEEFKQALVADTGFVEVYNNIGLAYLNLRKYEEAIAAYRKALKISPQTPQLHLNLGVVYEEQGLIKEAIEEYKKALALKPNYEKARRNIEGLLQRRQNAK